MNNYAPGNVVLADGDPDWGDGVLGDDVALLYEGVSAVFDLKSLTPVTF